VCVAFWQLAGFYADNLNAAGVNAASFEEAAIELLTETKIRLGWSYLKRTSDVLADYYAMFLDGADAGGLTASIKDRDLDLYISKDSPGPKDPRKQVSIQEEDAAEEQLTTLFVKLEALGMMRRTPDGFAWTDPGKRMMMRAPGQIGSKL
jgi:hypothetical protein